MVRGHLRVVDICKLKVESLKVVVYNLLLANSYSTDHFLRSQWVIAYSRELYTPGQRKARFCIITLPKVAILINDKGEDLNR